eukprot:6568594-Pyramimonas_sp.AAC.1
MQAPGCLLDRHHRYRVKVDVLSRLLPTGLTVPCMQYLKHHVSHPSDMSQNVQAVSVMTSGYLNRMRHLVRRTRTATP